MSCSGSGCAFFRQLTTVVVEAADTAIQVVNLDVPMIAWGWWKVGKRLVFEVPAKGVLYSDTTFGIRLRDNTGNTEHVLGSVEIPAGCEVDTFRLVCDVVDINNAEVVLKCWVDYPFPTGEDAPMFLDVTFDAAFRPLLPQVYFVQSVQVESEITFQNVQFSGFGNTSPLVC